MRASSPLEAMPPSGSSSTALTAPSWKRSTSSAAFLRKDQRTTAVSKLPDTACEPSADMASARTGPPWPRNCASAGSVATSSKMISDVLRIMRHCLSTYGRVLNPPLPLPIRRDANRQMTPARRARSRSQNCPPERLRQGYRAEQFLRVQIVLAGFINYSQLIMPLGERIAQRHINL